MHLVQRCQSFIIIMLLTGVFSLQSVPLVQADPSRTSTEPLLVIPGLTVRTSIEPLLVIPGLTVAPGTGSILVRTHDAVGATVHAFGLVPGNVYSFWVTAFNNPKKCATTPCSAADVPNPEVQVSITFGSSQIAGEDGTVDFTAFRAVGDLTGVYLGPGLLKPYKAQIHLVVRSHGPASADPAVLQQQLTMFNGGCPPNTCMNAEVAIHEP
ncbi:MAG: hypothetical protein HY268_34370 [Deltaproteobacteria bacterium]|nr:hypothetical protein [Deltaproteobacteria bacterium]